MEEVAISLLLMLLMLQRASTVVAAQQTNDVIYHQTASCSPSDQISVWTSVVRCQPRPTLVELPLPMSGDGAGSIVQLMPGHVMVDRCSGSCHGPAHSCLPTSADNTTVQVMAVQTTFASGAWNTVCSMVQVERHLSCQCSCQEREEHCDKSAQKYDSAGCQCRCLDDAARMECVSSGKQWNARTCSCACPQRTWRACSTGFSFDYNNTCTCVRTYSLASGGLTVLVGVAAMAFMGVSALVFRMKRRKRDVAVSRRPSIPRQQCQDAFLEADAAGTSAG